MRVDYRFRTGEAYFNAAYDRYRKQHWFRRYADAIKWIGLAVLVPCWVAVVFQRVWMLATVLTLFVMFIWFSPKLERYFRSRKLQKSPFWNEDNVVSLTDDGLEVKSSFSHGGGTWEVFTRAVRFRDGWLLFHGPQLFRWLPDAALVDGSMPIVTESLIRSHVRDVRQHA